MFVVNSNIWVDKSAIINQITITAAAAKMKIGKLSKGNQQKIQIISTLVSKPRLLILDEPFSGLDPVNVQLVAQVIEEQQRAGTSILLSTHQMNQAEAFCKNIYLFNGGKVILQGPLEPPDESCVPPQAQPVGGAQVV